MVHFRRKRFDLVSEKGRRRQYAASMKGLLLGTTSWELLHEALRANFDGKSEHRDEIKVITAVI